MGGASGILGSATDGGELPVGEVDRGRVACGGLRTESAVRGGPGFHELSHGEGFLQMLRTRGHQRGFYLMDEPAAPRSFAACLGLAGLLHDLARPGPPAVRSEE